VNAHGRLARAGHTHRGSIIDRNTTGEMMSVRHGREICSPIIRRKLRLPGSVPHHLDVPRVPVGCRAPLRLGQGTVTRLGAGPQDPKRRPSLGLGWSQTVHADLRTEGRSPSDLILTFIRKLSALPHSPRPDPTHPSGARWRLRTCCYFGRPE
jgi:hypothetical protein